MKGSRKSSSYPPPRVWLKLNVWRWFDDSDDDEDSSSFLCWLKRTMACEWGEPLALVCVREGINNEAHWKAEERERDDKGWKSRDKHLSREQQTNKQDCMCMMCVMCTRISLMTGDCERSKDGKRAQSYGICKRSKIAPIETLKRRRLKGPRTGAGREGIYFFMMKKFWCPQGIESPLSEERIKSGN